MTEKFVVACRYEHLTINGKKFTNWYYVNTIGLSENDAKEYMDKKKSDSKDIDKSTKLKHEFKLVAYDEYQKQLSDAQMCATASKKRYDEYKKSVEYKEIQKKKREERKQAKLRQEKYMMEHTQNEM